LKMRERVTSPSVSPEVTSTRSQQTKRRIPCRRSCRCTSRSVVGPCLSFTLFTFVFVPVVLFAVSAFFGIFLWRVECDEAESDARRMLKAGTITVDLDGACDYYQWFLYILGNLVALGTPLTNVTPVAVNWFGEVLDLLISAWSISLSATAFGVVGALTFTNFMSTSMDQMVIRRTLSNKIEALAGEADGGMNLAEFRAVAKEMLPQLFDDEIDEAFKSADGNNNGNIDTEEAQELLRGLRESTNPHSKTERLVLGLQGTVASLQTDVASLHAKLDRLLQLPQSSE